MKTIVVVKAIDTIVLLEIASPQITFERKDHCTITLPV